MTPEQAAKIARRIGMEMVEDDWGERWWDNGTESADAKHGISPADLPTYLTTGDRPLRILESFRDPGLSRTPDGLNWWCEADTDFPGTQAVAPTAAAAILACAAAIEGDGHE